MTFTKKQTLQDKDSSIQIDVESMARIELSDIEYLLTKIEAEQDSRLIRIMYETIISKTSTVFQLALKGCKYLQCPLIKKEIQSKFPKDSPSGIGAIAKFRDDMFHDGISFVKKDTYYPFAKISGRGFVAIRIKKGATYTVKNIYTFHSDENDYAITSEGVFEIYNYSQENENWMKLNELPFIESNNYDEISNIIKDAVKDLKKIWKDLSQVREKGDGTTEYRYNNNAGSWELMERKNGGINTYKANEITINVEGHLTVTPPSKMII